MPSEERSRGTMPKDWAACSRCGTEIPDRNAAHSVAINASDMTAAEPSKRICADQTWCAAEVRRISEGFSRARGHFEERPVVVTHDASAVGAVLR